MANHAVVRTDKMYGTDVRSGLVSIKYIVDSEPAEIENGNVLKLGALMDGEREIYEGSTPSASDSIDDIILVASPEVMYDERLKNLDDFINVAGKPARGYILHHKDIFSVTEEALDGADENAVGKDVCLQDSTKLAITGESGESGETSGETGETGESEAGTAIGRVIAIDVVGRYTYYVIEIN